MAGKAGDLGGVRQNKSEKTDEVIKGPGSM